MSTHVPAAHFLDRILDPLASSLNEEAARSVLDVRIDPEVQARVAFLAGRANEGELTPDERDEYLSYVEAADLLAIFKLKARRHMNAQLELRLCNTTSDTGSNIKQAGNRHK